MRVLILSCNTGEGHNSCAKAIKEVYDANGHDCDLVDALKFISRPVSHIIGDGHVFLYRYFPGVFNWGYKSAEKHSSLFSEKSFLYRFFSLGSKRLNKFIVSGEYEVVISTHAFASLMLTEARNRYNTAVKTAFVATDYTCSPSVQDTKMDYYFIPDESLAGEFLSPNIPKEKIVPSGIPIRTSFYANMEKSAAKEKFGIDKDHTHLVMMCGSMGCGPIKKLTKLLIQKIPDDFELSVICGTNKRLKKRLTKKHGAFKNIHILGYVDEMSALFDSADVFITKPGGMSVTEARVKKTPMVFLNTVAGCEDHNANFFVNAGLAKLGQDINNLIEVCCGLSVDSDEYNKLKENAQKQDVVNSAECVYKIMQ